MKKRVLALTVVLVALVFAFGPASLAQAVTGYFPTSDYCGFVWRDGSTNSHNGVDIWTNQSGTGLSGSKGFPVQLAQDGYLDQIYYYPGTSVAYGLRFWHPDPGGGGISTHYWHMADSNTPLTSYVETTLTVGAFYPAGTFLGYQGDLTTVGATLTHLHVTVWNQRAADNGSLSTSINPSTFFGRNLDALNGGKCYTGSVPTDNSIHYRGPLPATPHNYPDNFGRWYVIVNYDTGASVTRGEFCNFSTEANFDFARTYNFGLGQYDTFSGFLTPPNLLTSAASGRVLFIRFDSDASVNYYGFDVCNFHSF